MTSELSNKVALVTGGASGIGRASVLALSGAGTAAAVLDRDEAGATALVGKGVHDDSLPLPCRAACSRTP